MQITHDALNAPLPILRAMYELQMKRTDSFFLEVQKRLASALIHLHLIHLHLLCFCVVLFSFFVVFFFVFQIWWKRNQNRWDNPYPGAEVATFQASSLWGAKRQGGGHRYDHGVVCGEFEISPSRAAVTITIIVDRDYFLYLRLPSFIYFIYKVA